MQKMNLGLKCAFGLLLLFVGNAHADINFYVTNERDPAHHIDHRVVVFSARKLNGAHNTGEFAVIENDTQKGSVSSSIFAPDPSGDYEVQIFCNNGYEYDYFFRESSLKKQVTLSDGDTAYFKVLCKYDANDALEIPQIKQYIEHHAA